MQSRQRAFHVLGIESSCDDTGVSIIRNDGLILSNSINSQLRQHLLNGGVIPVIAKEYHLNNIDKVAQDAFKKSGLTSVARDIDAIAVSSRPGMNFSLQIGLNYARKLAKKYTKPLIPIHHMQAHALMPLFQHQSIRFPFIAMLLSGGHCLLAIAKRYNEFHLLGSTLDEAPGDFLDKFARRSKIRNLGTPFDSISGGAAIELLASQENSDRFKYFGSLKSVPMIGHRGCDFSFSGYRGCLEIAEPIVDNLWTSGNRNHLKTELGHLCASIQRMILIQLVKKLQRAMLFYRMHWRYKNEDAFAEAGKTIDHLGYKIMHIENDDTDNIDVVISGGVAANNYLTVGIRLACQQCFDPNIKVYTPEKRLCSDNGLMIAWNGLLRYKDYFENEVKFSSYDLDESVIFNPEDLDSLKVKAECPIGVDLREEVMRTDFKLPKLSHSEFKLK